MLPLWTHSIAACVIVTYWFHSIALATSGSLLRPINLPEVRIGPVTLPEVEQPHSPNQ